MTLTDDLWGWAEVDEAVPVFPTFGVRIARTRFPPNPSNPAIHFRRYDPNAPSLTAPGGSVNTSFNHRDYSLWAGWNRNKSHTYIVGKAMELNSFTPQPAPLGTDLHFVRVPTTDPDLKQWIPDWSNPWFVPSTITNIRDIRFIPRTNHIAFIATQGSTNLFRLTDNFALSILATDVIRYAYSFDGTYLALQHATTSSSAPGVRVYERDGIGAPGTQVSSGDSIFDFTPTGFFFSDDSIYILAFHSSKHVVHQGTPPFSFDFSVSTFIGTGLFGPQPIGIQSLAAHPTRDYIYRYGTVSLGLGGSNFYTHILTWFGEFVASRGRGPSLEWSQTGDVTLAADGGRDPYGGIVTITKTGTWEFNNSGFQEWEDIRVRPFH